MSISELNQFMTYVLDGWLLFSASSVGIGLVSFVSRRIQEDIAAENLAIAQATEVTVSVTETAESTVIQTVSAESDEAARLEEVAAVSEQLAKNKGKQSDTSSVSVST
ncbi:MAG: hypothetical protein WA783_20475 [Phormidesmis sp.]